MEDKDVSWVDGQRIAEVRARKVSNAEFSSRVRVELVQLFSGKRTTCADGTRVNLSVSNQHWCAVTHRFLLGDISDLLSHSRWNRSDGDDKRDVLE